MHNTNHKKPHLALALALVMVLLLAACRLTGADAPETPEAPEIAEQPAETASVSGGVTVTVLEPENDGQSLVLRASIENALDEDITWQARSVSIGGMTLPVDADCFVAAGETVIYRYSVNLAAARMFGFDGTWEATLRYAVTDADGVTISEGVTEALTLDL